MCARVVLRLLASMRGSRTIDGLAFSAILTRTGIEKEAEGGKRTREGCGGSRQYKFHAFEASHSSCTPQELHPSGRGKGGRGGGRGPAGD